MKEKTWLATQDSFDYSSFALAGILAGIGQAKNSTPEFRQGGAGFGRYYWHSFADQALGNYLAEAIVPVATREDPRYYTLGHGGFFRRSGYAFSRLLITRTDSGGTASTSPRSSETEQEPASPTSITGHPNVDQDRTEVVNPGCH